MHINTHIPMLSPRFNKFLLNFCQLIDTILGTGDTVERGKKTNMCHSENPSQC